MIICQLMCYEVGTHAVAVVFPCVFRKFEVGERFEPKIEGGGTAFPCVLWYFKHWSGRYVPFSQGDRNGRNTSINTKRTNRAPITI